MVFVSSFLKREGWWVLCGGAAFYLDLDLDLGLDLARGAPAEVAPPFSA